MEALELRHWAGLPEAAGGFHFQPNEIKTWLALHCVSDQCFYLPVSLFCVLMEDRQDPVPRLPSVNYEHHFRHPSTPSVPILSHFVPYQSKTKA